MPVGKNAQAGFGLLSLVIGLAIILAIFFLMRGTYFRQGAVAGTSRPGTIIDSAKKQLEAAREQHASGGIE